MGLEDILFGEDVVSKESAMMDGIEGMDVVENEVSASPDLSSYVPDFATKMLETIDEVDEYSWKRGEMGGLDWGFEKMNKAFEGLNTGVHLVAGASNIGRHILYCKKIKKIFVL